jgi:hypothetical protein
MASQRHMHKRMCKGMVLGLIVGHCFMGTSDKAYKTALVVAAVGGASFYIQTPIQASENGMIQAIRESADGAANTIESRFEKQSAHLEGYLTVTMMHFI